MSKPTDRYRRRERARLWAKCCRLLRGVAAWFVDVSERARAQARLRESQQQLRDSESKVRAILETAMDGIITVDSQGSILTANRAAERIFGYLAHEMVGNKINMLMSKPNRSTHDGYIERYLRTGEQRIIGIGREVQGRRKDGSVFPMELSVGEATVGGSRIFTGIVRDITQRKRTEGDLRAILDHSPALISIKDVKGNIRLASRSYGVLDGPPVERLIGMNVFDLYPPEAADEMWRSDLESLVSGQPVETEETLRHRDGTMHTYLTVKFPVYQDDDAFGICNILFCTDITIRKQAEAEVRKLTQALHQSPVSVVITDPSGSIEYVNPKFCDVTGYALGEVLGQNPRIVKSGNTDPGEYDALWQTITSGQVWRGELHNRRKDGTLFWEMVSIAPVRDEQGEITHFIALKEDITERKAMEQQLRHTQQLQALGQLTGGIAHDFNNLLAIITGNLELLSDRLELDPPSKAMLSDALWSAQRGGELTHRLLAFARRQPLRPALTELNQVVRGMSGLLRRTLGTGITVRERLAPDLWTACIDRGELERAIVNLAVNGRDAMGTNGTLSIETRNVHLDDKYAEQYGDMAAGDYAEISIIDTGSGMTPDVLKRVFEPFFTTKEFGKGSGLGLSMVYGFAKQSGGHIGIYSELDKGTTVNLYLPRAGADDVNGSSAVTPNGLSDVAILVVEDEDRPRTVALKMLQNLGLVVCSAADSREAGAGWIAKPYSKTELGQAVAALLGGRH